MSEVRIVSRWDREKVLFVAEGASDVKVAVEAARAARAYLQGADLRGTDLRDADLRGAYLQGADLQGADLQGADLRGAYLQGAYLRDAYLQGADLRGADLQGADLQDAVWAQVADVLQRALSQISITGHWIKGSLSRTLDSGEEAYCAIGAVRHEGEGTVLALASWLLAVVAGGSVETFNDAKATTLADVQAAFSLAIVHAKRWAGDTVVA